MEQEYISCRFAFNPQCRHFTDPIISDLFLLANEPNRCSIDDEKFKLANTVCVTCDSFMPHPAKEGS
jgi:hypothetical protein